MTTHQQENQTERAGEDARGARATRSRMLTWTQRRASDQTERAGEDAHAAHTGHPTPATYFKVAMALSVLTAIEVGIFYITSLSYAIIPVLAVLSIGKFALVVMYYMHLKFDHWIFSGMFFFGMFVATGVIFALMALFSWFLL